MLVSKEIVKNEIISMIMSSISTLPFSWSNVANGIGANYIVKNNIDKYMNPFVLEDGNINISDLEQEFLSKIEEIKKTNPSAIGSNGEIFKIPMINTNYVITEQEVRDLIINIKNKASI